LAEEQFDLGAGKLFDAGQVFFRPGVLLGHAVRFRWP
jgi:hypothetical protein